VSEKQVFMTDISQVETDQLCGMKYWYGHCEAGTGIIRKSDIVSVMMDNKIHDDLRMLSTLEDISPLNIQAIIDEALAHLSESDKTDINKMELLYRRLGWFAGFAMFMESTLRADYETLTIDPAIVMDRDPLFVMAYPDRLIKNKHDNHIVYREYVPQPPGLRSESWLQGWHYKIRLHVGLAAARDMELKPASGQVMGLSTGYRSVLDNHLVHPYVWGWFNKSTDEWAPNRPETMKGNWESCPVWKFPAGIVSWVRMCGEQAARSQFQLSPSVILNRDILDGWVAQRVHREREIQEIRVVGRQNFHLRHIYFPRVTSQCTSPNGEMCAYKEACWDKTVGLMPLKSDIYTVKIPFALGELSS
jgi:hypothetical protein